MADCEDLYLGKCIRDSYCHYQNTNILSFATESAGITTCDRDLEARTRLLILLKSKNIPPIREQLSQLGYTLN